MLKKDEVNNIVSEKKFHHVLQPLFCMEDWKQVGFEALLRFHSVDNSKMLFKSAIEHNLLYELDTCSIYNILNTDWIRNNRLFVNVYPSTIMNPLFIGFLDDLNEFCTRSSEIIFEISEAEKVLDLSSFRQIVDILKQKGYGIAIKDLGIEETSLKSVIDLEPDYVKLDKSISKGLFNSDKKQNEVKMMLEVCQQKKMKLILGDIEDEKDLAIAKMLGVHIGQGFLLGKPLE
ncbi:EAL domain-containing protein [Jeotgalibacillus malaysiensis]|uniref:EAL domain-containing protein n=1 Tax=Jeotgalibacillus malaysiensis TaxID=1508404 RepID=UPI003850B0EA